MAGFPCDSLKMTPYVVFGAYVCVGMHCFMYESLCLCVYVCVGQKLILSVFITLHIIDGASLSVESGTCHYD